MNLYSDNFNKKPMLKCMLRKFAKFDTSTLANIIAKNNDEKINLLVNFGCLRYY